MSDHIVDLARRVGQDPYFLASPLAAYARSERLDEQGLANAIGCTVDALTLLRLCRRPRSEPAAFRDDIERIAVRFDADPAALAQVVRRADAIEALRGSEGNAGLLMAARDRNDEDSPNSGMEGQS